MRREPGQRAELTIFFALITALIFALFLVILESARTEAARLHLTIAANSSIDSLFSQYHRELWDEYRLLGLEQYSYEQLSDEMEDFISPYFEADNWLSMELSSIEISNAEGLTDANAEHFEQEVLDYMQYGIVASIWDLADIELFSSGAGEGPNTEVIAELYDDHAKEAEKIEKKIVEIADAAGEAAEYVWEAGRAAGRTDGDEVIRDLRLAIEKLETLPDLVDKYEALADQLEEGVLSSREEMDAKKASGEISAETWSLLNQDIAEYESYILADGERRQEIIRIKSKSSIDITYLEHMIEKTQDVMEYIDNYEYDDEDDEGPDEEALYSPIEYSLSTYDAITVNGSYGVEDEEQLGKIESLKDLLSGSLLSLVLPDGASVSSDGYKMGDSPSEFASDGFNESRLNLLESVYVAEYMTAVSGYFGRGVYDDESSKGTAQCEAEYLIAGEDNDEANLSFVVERLMLLRSGLNLIYLYSDNAKRSEARALSMTICGVAALTPLSSVVTFLIMSVWAMGQALIDIRSLLRGEKVPFIHSDESFSLTLSGLLSMAESDAGESDAGGSDKGLTYRDYLRIFIFFDMGSELCYRMMDVIQMNLMTQQSDFEMLRLIYSLEAEVRVSAAHVFSESGLVRQLSDSLGRDYQMSVTTAYSY